MDVAANLDFTTARALTDLPTSQEHRFSTCFACLFEAVQTNGSLHPQQNPLPDHAASQLFIHLGTQTEYRRKFKKEENKQHFIL